MIFGSVTGFMKARLDTNELRSGSSRATTLNLEAQTHLPPWSTFSTSVIKIDPLLRLLQASHIHCPSSGQKIVAQFPDSVLKGKVADMAGEQSAKYRQEIQQVKFPRPYSILINGSTSPSPVLADNIKSPTWPHPLTPELFPPC